MPNDATRDGPPEARAARDADWRTLERASVTTTQSEAASLAAKGERGPLWVRADVQTQGRGRSGRDWATPSGNFAATLVLGPGCDIALLPQLSLVAGVAAADAVNGVLAEAWRGGGADGTRAPAVTVRLKWPNDLLIGSAKLGGILVETSSLGQDALALIGIGINLAEAPELAGRAVTRLADHLPGDALVPPPHDLLDHLAPAMHRWLGVWDRGHGFAAIRAAWLDRALAPGAAISVNAGEGPVEGTFAGLDTDGSLLLLEPTGIRRRFSWGDVTLQPAKA